MTSPAKTGTQAERKPAMCGLCQYKNPKIWSASMKFIHQLAMHAAGSVYEIVTGRSHTQRTIKRKAVNVVRWLKGKEPLRSWEDGRTNTTKRSPAPSAEECERLNREAARSI